MVFLLFQACPPASRAWRARVVSFVNLADQARTDLVLDVKGARARRSAVVLRHALMNLWRSKVVMGRI